MSWNKKILPESVNMDFVEIGSGHIAFRYEYGQVPEPEMPWFVGRPLFLEADGSGKAAAPLAILPLLAWR